MKKQYPWNKGKKLSKKIREKYSKNHADFNGKNNPMYGVHRFGEKAANWKGGKIKHGNGYWMIYSPKHPFCNSKGYVFEHRLVVEKIIGRYLKPQENVHHINRKKTDNLPQNLIAFSSNTAHKRFEAGRSVKTEEIIFDGRSEGYSNTPPVEVGDYVVSRLATLKDVGIIKKINRKSCFPFYVEFMYGKSQWITGCGFRIIPKRVYHEGKWEKR